MRKPYLWLLITVPLVLCCIGIWLLIKFVPQQPTSKKSLTPYIEGVTLLPASEGDIHPDWFTVPIATGRPMFCPVMIPFTVTFQGVPVDDGQRLTFPALLDYKFYFVPDNANTICPAFVYRKDARLQKLTNTKPRKIAEYISQWSATHAIGGSITVTTAGYIGSMLVYDANGICILQKSYNIPVPYFTLMGRMVEDWMDYRQQPCSPALCAELERPMTTNMETVRLFGTTFNVEWRSEQEWEIYHKILDIDPKFGEIRHWYANQKGWANGQSDTPTKEAEYARAFLDHPVISAIRECQLSQIKDVTLRAQAQEATARALDIVPDQIGILWHRLDINPQQYYPDSGGLLGGSNIEGCTIAQADALILPAAKQYPQDWNLQHTVGSYYFRKGQIQKGVPLNINSEQNKPNATGLYALTGYLYAGKGYWHAGQGQAALYYLQLSLQHDKGMQGEALRNTIALYRDFLDYPDAVALANTYKLYHQQSRDLDTQLLLLSLYEGNMPIDEKMQALVYPQRNLDFPEDIRKLLVEKKFGEIPMINIAATTDPELLFVYADAYHVIGRSGSDVLAKRSWQCNPRVPRLGKQLAEAFMQKSPQDIARYAEVMTWLAPDINYWKTLHKGAIDAGAVEESNEDVAALLNEWIGKANKIKVENTTEFWKAAPPFIVEYLVMRTLASHQEEPINASLMLYTKYATSMATQIIPTTQYFHMWDNYTMHLNAFNGKVINQLPTTLLEKWQPMLDPGYQVQ